MNRTLRNSLATAVAGGAILALPALALGVATGSGASFPATAYTKWCQDSGLCSYTSKGSTGGINDFINGVVDFAATDAPHMARARRQAHSSSPASIRSSNPVQAACTRSYTSSKPFPAP